MQIALRKLIANFHPSVYLKTDMHSLSTLTSLSRRLMKYKMEERSIISPFGFKWMVSKNAFSFVNIVKPFLGARMQVGVDQFLNAHQLQFISGHSVYKLKYCPFCLKPHHNDPTNLHTFNIHKENGCFHCFRCEAKGNWFQFRERILGFPHELVDNVNEGSPIPEGRSKIGKLSDAEFYFYRSNINKEEYKEVVEYLHSRGFKDETIAQYNLGAGTQEFYDENGNKKQVKCVYFPAYKILQEEEQKQLMLNQFKRDSSLNFYSNNNWSEIVKAKIRGSGKQNKKYMRQLPVGSQKGFFGLNLIKDSDKQIVLTEGEFDAMAVYQQTGIPALSLPQGATNLSESLLPYLQRFQRIVLWMDNDDAGILNTNKMVEKLGVNRTAVVKHNIPKLKDANDFLMNDPDRISELIKTARTIPDSSLLSFHTLRSKIYDKITKTQQNNGVKVQWLPFFNKTVKGVRMGELSIMSGPTGSGKTTFLSQMTLSLCRKDISVLWGSFEIRNEILITSMLYQFSDLRLDKHLQKYNHYANQFQKLPLHFMDFYGSHSIDKILTTIVYSIEKYNVHIVVIDTLQFLLSEQAEGFKKFELQDTLMARLRQISIKYNVHVIIVIHPRKTDDSEDLGIHSIYGTSKATQEADNIWIIQNRENYKILDVRKNRYDGELGRFPLGFNRNTKNFFQFTKSEFEALRFKEKTMHDIINERELEKSKQTAEQIQYDRSFQDEILDSELDRVKKNVNPFKQPAKQ